MNIDPVNIHYSIISTTGDEGKWTDKNAMEAEIDDGELVLTIKFSSTFEGKVPVLDMEGTTKEDSNVSTEEYQSIRLPKESAEDLLEILKAYVNGDAEDLEEAFKEVQERTKEEERRKVMNKYE